MTPGRLRNAMTYLWLGVLATLIGLASGPSVATPSAERCVNELQQALQNQGVEAMLTFYRQQLQQPRSIESCRDEDTRQWANALLDSGQIEAALRLLELRAERQPAKPELWRQLARAATTAANQSLAVAAYEHLLQRSPEDKEARYALYHLVGRSPGPFPAVVIVHMIGGALGIAAGFLAMMVRKGRRAHALAGTLFVLAMLAMSISACVRALQDLPDQWMNFWMGLVALYMVSTSWLTIRRRADAIIAWPVVVFSGIGLIAFVGLLDVFRRGGAFAPPALVFSAFVLMAVVGDWRVARTGALAANTRLRRHLWRMGAALFIATASLFLGQMQVFPMPLQTSGVLALPVLVVLIAFVYWFVRYRPAVATPRPLQTKAPP